jgi:hypothetical protein
MCVVLRSTDSMMVWCMPPSWPCFVLSFVFILFIITIRIYRFLLLLRTYLLSSIYGLFIPAHSLVYLHILLCTCTFSCVPASWAWRWLPRQQTRRRWTTQPYYYVLLFILLLENHRSFIITYLVILLRTSIIIMIVFLYHGHDSGSDSHRPKGRGQHNRTVIIITYIVLFRT